MGRKGSSHHEINHMIHTDMEKLSKCSYRYYGKLQKYIPVVVRIFSVSADRPERSELTKISSHAGNYTKRWMYTASVNQKRFPSCDNCFRSHLAYAIYQKNYQKGTFQVAQTMI